MPHLLVDITAHGYGHIAQTAPVVNELVRRVPDLRVTVRSAASTAYLQQRFNTPFQHIPTALDFGMTMFNAVEVDIPRSLENYREYHADWDAKVETAAALMRSLKPDLLFANVPYLSLAAAHAAEIPALAMCCLNWADIYHHYAADDAESRTIHAQMLSAYNSARAFLKVQPSMPMPGLHNAVKIAPIAQLGVGASLLAKANIASKLAPTREMRQSEIKWVLVAMGGIDYRLPMENWPTLSGVRWLIPQAWNIQREDITTFETLGMSFSDVLASCDAVLTKPGYGTFAEAACAGVPVLYVSRGEWPEQKYLIDWLQQNGVCLEVSASQLHCGDLAIALEQLWSCPKPNSPTARGANEAADCLENILSAS
jgi:UDP:flavonoid glycosyltransferase YjiC (YdhE family)